MQGEVQEQQEGGRRIERVLYIGVQLCTAWYMVFGTLNFICAVISSVVLCWGMLSQGWAATVCYNISWWVTSRSM